MPDTPIPQPSVPQPPPQPAPITHQGGYKAHQIEAFRARIHRRRRG